MSEREQNRMLDVLVAYGSSEDEALETVISLTEDGEEEKEDEQKVLQRDLLLELNECY